MVEFRNLTMEEEKEASASATTTVVVSATVVQVQSANGSFRLRQNLNIGRREISASTTTTTRRHSHSNNNNNRTNQRLSSSSSSLIFGSSRSSTSSSRKRPQSARNFSPMDLDMSIHSLDNYGGSGGGGGASVASGHGNPAKMTLQDIKSSVQAALQSDKEAAAAAAALEQQQQQQQVQNISNASITPQTTAAKSLVPPPVLLSLDQAKLKLDRQARRFKIRSLAETKHSSSSTSSRSLSSVRSTQSARAKRYQDKDYQQAKSKKKKEKDAAAGAGNSTTATATGSNKKKRLSTAPRTPSTRSSRSMGSKLSQSLSRIMSGGSSAGGLVPKSPARLNQHLRRQAARHRDSLNNTNANNSLVSDTASVGSASVRSIRSTGSGSRHRVPRRPRSPTTTANGTTVSVSAASPYAHASQYAKSPRHNKDKQQTKRRSSFQVPFTAQEEQKSRSFQVIAASCCAPPKAAAASATASSFLAIPNLGMDAASTANNNINNKLATPGSRRRASARSMRSQLRSTPPAMVGGMPTMTSQPKSIHCPMRRATRRMTVSTSSLSYTQSNSMPTTAAVATSPSLAAGDVSPLSPYSTSSSMTPTSNHTSSLSSPRTPSANHQKCSLLFQQDNDHVPSSSSSRRRRRRQGGRSNASTSHIPEDSSINDDFDYSIWNPYAQRRTVDKKSKYKQLLLGSSTSASSAASAAAAATASEKKVKADKTTTATNLTDRRQSARERCRRESSRKLHASSSAILTTALDDVATTTTTTTTTTTNTNTTTNTVVTAAAHNNDSSDDEDLYVEDDDDDTNVGVGDVTTIVMGDTVLLANIDAAEEDISQTIIIVNTAEDGVGNPGTAAEVIEDESTTTEGMAETFEGTADTIDIADENTAADVENSDSEVVPTTYLQSTTEMVSTNTDATVVVLDEFPSATVCNASSVQKPPLSVSTSTDHSSETQGTKAIDAAKARGFVGEIDEEQNEPADEAALADEQLSAIITASDANPLVIGRLIDPSSEEYKASASGQTVDMLMVSSVDGTAALGRDKASSAAHSDLKLADTPEQFLSEEEATNSADVVILDDEVMGNDSSVNNALSKDLAEATAPNTPTKEPGSGDKTPEKIVYRVSSESTTNNGSIPPPPPPPTEIPVECPGTPKKSNVSAKGMEVGMIRIAIRGGLIRRAGDPRAKRRDQQIRTKAKSRSSRPSKDRSHRSADGVGNLRTESGKKRRLKKPEKGSFLDEVTALMNSKSPPSAKTKKKSRPRDPGDCEKSSATNEIRRRWEKTRGAHSASTMSCSTRSTATSSRARSASTMSSSTHSTATSSRADKGLRPSRRKSSSAASASALSSSTHPTVSSSRANKGPRPSRRNSSSVGTASTISRKVNASPPRKRRPSTSAGSSAHSVHRVRRSIRVEAAPAAVPTAETIVKEAALAPSVEHLATLGDSGQDQSAIIFVQLEAPNDAQECNLHSGANPQTPSNSQSSHASVGLLLEVE